VIKNNQRYMNTIRNINENLTKHLETLDGLDRKHMNDHMKMKRKEYSSNLTKTTNRVDKILEKLGI